ncbi:hypothetical protein J1G18_07415 [Pseudomonas sp. MIS38]|uniref:hypothetical protein n=1 Tax=Pseudomonas sp. MIS38 TaxID=91465 RepID=UPI001CA6831A|nr:hypothetical protein [Pseudomonas sp. MIS38]MBY8957110.1 hypothetical protein [Pseudomonas sp. MIS38]
MDLGSTDVYVSLFSGLSGAIIGGLFTLKGATKAHELALKKEEAADREKMITTLMLLRTEIATAWEIFMKEYGQALSLHPPETPFLVIMPLGASPFPIFESAPQALNLLPRELAKDIIYFYMRAKGVIAMIEINNRDYEQALQFGRSYLSDYMQRARDQGKELTDEMREQVIESSVGFMAAQLGMGDTADGIRSLGQELKPIVLRIIARVDELVFPDSDLLKQAG